MRVLAAKAFSVCLSRCWLIDLIARESNRQAMLECGDERLVHAYRNYEFHQDDATLIDELEDLRRHARARPGGRDAALARRVL